jgi:metal-responsive CopG/Arc/MetJ family transcriptional regulator
MKKLGIAIPDDLAEQIDEPLEYGDSRSERMRDLIRVGLAVEERLHYHEFRHLDTRGQIEAARAGIDYYVREESKPEP